MRGATGRKEHVGGSRRHVPGTAKGGNRQSITVRPTDLSKDNLYFEHTDAQERSHDSSERPPTYLGLIQRRSRYPLETLPKDAPRNSRICRTPIKDLL